MILAIDQLLAAPDLEALRPELDRLEFRDGKATAGGFARQVKDNLQAEPRSARGVIDFVVAALERHPVVRAGALPRRIGSVMASKYEPGMAYGPHVDNALMGPSVDRLRSDLAFTVFLAPPTDYDGGELVVMAPDGARALKLPQGAALIYPATPIHRVAPVTRGVRLAVVGWIESHVRGAAEREILFDLANLRESVTDPAHMLVLDKARENLLRLWVGR